MNEKAKCVENITMRFINSRRANRGENRLDSDYDLMAAARNHARDMAQNNYVSHADMNGRSPRERVKKYRHVGECINKHHGWDDPSGTIAAKLVKAWMTSKNHRMVILSGKMDRQGVGIWKAGDAIYSVYLSAQRKDQVKFGENILTRLFS